MAIKSVQPTTYTSEITIEEVTGDLNRKVTLRGPTLPHKGASWGSNLRVSTTWYGGNAIEATQQILGPTEAPTTFEGFWRRTMMGKHPATYYEAGNETKITTPFVLMGLMENICREGSRIRVTWVSSGQIDKYFSLVREGRAKTIIFTPETESDIGWKIEWEWMSRGATQQRVVSIRGTDPSDEAAQLLLDMNQLADDFYTDIVINTDGQKKKKGQGVPNLTLDQLSKLADYPNDLIKGVTRDLQRVTKQFENAVDVANKFANVPNQIQNTVTQAMENTKAIVKQHKKVSSAIPAENMSKSTGIADVLRNVVFSGKYVERLTGIGEKSQSVMASFLAQYSRSGIGGGQISSQQASGTTTQNVEKLYVTMAGDTPASVSIKFFETPEKALDILKSNNLPWTLTQFDPGKMLIIPTVLCLPAITSIMSTIEFPEQSYYPSAKARLILRFDEMKQRTEAVVALAPKVPPQLLRGRKGVPAPLQPVVDEQAPPGVTRYYLMPKGGYDSQILKKLRSKDGLTQPLGAIIPKEADLGINGIRQADTLNMTFRWSDLPFDPRIIRACRVQYYLGCLTEKQFRQGIQGGVRLTGATNYSSPSVEPLNVVPDEYIDVWGRPRTNLRFEGWVDKWEVEIPDEGEPIVRLDCRDNTVLLIDQKAPPQLYINAKEPIDRAIALYLSNFPRCAGLTVEYRPQNAEPPKLETTLAKTAYRPQLGPPPNGGSDLSVWDYITDVCGSIGHMCRMIGDRIVIQRVRTITSSDFTVRDDDPYVPRSVQKGKLLKYRHFIYGRNIKNMKIARQFSFAAMQNIEVRCYNPRRKTVQVARFPLPGDKVFGVLVLPGDVADQKWIVHRVNIPIEDPKQLRIIAQSVYEQINRGEFMTQLTTQNMASFGGGNLDPDILDMQPGDTFEVQVNRESAEFNTLTSVENMLLLQQRCEQYLKVMGYDGELAKVYAECYSNIGFQTTFRTAQIGLRWNCDTGVEVEIQGRNYLEVRADKSLGPDEPVRPPPGAQPKTTTQNSAAGKP